MAELINHAFSQAAREYQEFRPSYPPQLLQRLIEGGGGEWAVDLGTGPGTLAIPLASSFDRVTACDVSPEMIEQAKLASSHLDPGHVDFHVAAAEEIEIPGGSVDVTTIGAAFHWMNRSLIADRVFTWLRPGGVLGLFSAGSSWSSDAPWQVEIKSVIRTYLGQERRAGSSATYIEPPVRHEVVLMDAGFTIHSYEMSIEHKWSSREVLGYLRTTSFAGRAALGQAHEDFEEQVSVTLSAYEAKQGPLIDVDQFRLILGRKL